MPQIAQLRIYATDKKKLLKLGKHGESQQDLMRRVVRLLEKHRGKAK